MNTQLKPEDILVLFEKNKDYQWLCSHANLINEPMRKNYHIDSLLYYVDSLKEALHQQSTDLIYYRHFQCYEEILHDICKKINLELYGSPFLSNATPDTTKSKPENSTNKKKKDGSRLSKKNISDEKVQMLYADAINDINSMQMDIFDFIQ